MLKDIITLAALGAALAVPAQAGRIVVFADEWALSDQAAEVEGANTDDVTALSFNIAQYLVQESFGSILVRSDNFGLNGSLFLGALETEGTEYEVTVDAAAPLTDLSGSYNAVFLAGNYPVSAAEVAGLIDFVNAGGGVFIAGGTGVGGAAAEAAAWNGFLGAFGLAFESEYNGVEGLSEADIDFPPLFSGVGFIYQNNGSNVVDLDPEDPSQFNLCNPEIFGGCDRPIPFYAVYDGDLVTAPAPGALALFGLGAAALSLGRRRR